MQRVDLVSPHGSNALDSGITQGIPQLEFASDFDRLNHNIFRFPAKFHPPVVRALIERFSTAGQTILDPFCGSGTTMVEALASGRSAIGTDVDPLSVFVSQAKVSIYNIERLENLSLSICKSIDEMRTADQGLWGEFNNDISDIDFQAISLEFSEFIPALPNIDHWFRRRVIVQLAAIRRHIQNFSGTEEHLFFNLCFASIIRNSSNADPVPVSGLEVTKHMREKEAKGRFIDPYTLFCTAMRKGVEATKRFQQIRHPELRARTVCADARHLSVRGTGPVDCVITSPPYLSAVDYYRRHTLEMYWLGLTASQTERLELLPRYLGRSSVSIQNLRDCEQAPVAEIAARYLESLPSGKPEKERAFMHYCVGMSEVLSRMAEITRPSGSIVIVVGNVRFNGRSIPISNLISDLAHAKLKLETQLWYPIVNRYMSYARKNGADIATDHVLVFKKRN